MTRSMRKTIYRIFKHGKSSQLGENPRHNLAKRSFKSVQIGNLNRKSACNKTFTVQSKLAFSPEMKVERPVRQ